MENLLPMAKIKSKSAEPVSDDKVESVKIKVSVVDKVRANKKKTGVNVGTFFEQAAEEKLKSQQKK